MIRRVESNIVMVKVHDTQWVLDVESPGNIIVVW